METPVDVLTHRLGKMVDNGGVISDPTALALSIDEELQEKFLSFPIEELEATHVNVSKSTATAGDGPEYAQCDTSANPLWILNKARNYLALYWHLKLEEERPKIPEPGVYLVTTVASGHATTAIVTSDKRVVVPQTGLGTMADKTFVFRNTESELVWQRVDLATGTISA